MKAVLLACILIFALASIFVFPPSKPDSSIFYVSSAFLCVSLALASGGKGLKAGMHYLLLERGKNSWLAIAGWSAAALASSVIAVLLLSAVLYSLGMLDNSSVLAKISSLSPLSLVLAFTLAPLAEEALFRGYLFRKMEEALSAPEIRPTLPSTLSGALLSSLAFALMHLSYGSASEIIAAFCLGMLFCFFTKKSGSLLPAAAAHASFNLISIIFNVVLA